MTFKRISKGRYYFKGIDNWNNQEIEGYIVYQPYDVKLSQVWSVVFNEGEDDVYRPFFASTLKECKQWLTN